jgi:ribose transport system substrate-binding protein
MTRNRRFLLTAMCVAGLVTTTMGGAALAQEESAAPADSAAAEGPIDQVGEKVSFPAKEPPYTIGVSESLGGTAWREIGLASMQVIANKEPWKDLIEEIKIVRTVGADVASQTRDMRNLIADGVDLIIYNPASPTALEPVIREANAAGIPVVAVNQKVDSEFAVTVATDCDAAGRIGGQWLADKLGSGKKVGIIEGLPGASCNDNTVKLAEEAIVGAGNEIVARGVSNWDESQAQKAMADMLQAHPELEGVYAPFVGGLGFVAAMDAADTWVPMVGGTGFNGEACNLVKYAPEGLVSLLTPGHQSIYAKGLVEALKILEGEEVVRTQLYPPLELTTDDPASYEALCDPELADVFGLSYQWPGSVGDPALFGEPLPISLEEILQYYDG